MEESEKLRIRVLTPKSKEELRIKILLEIVESQDHMKRAMHLNRKYGRLCKKYGSFNEIMLELLESGDVYRTVTENDTVAYAHKDIVPIIDMMIADESIKQIYSIDSGLRELAKHL